jgi:hypothetical protein
MIQGIKYGRIEVKVSGATTYIYRHKDFNAADDSEDWDAIRIVTAGSDKSIVIRKGNFSNYLTEW